MRVKPPTGGGRDAPSPGLYLNSRTSSTRLRGQSCLSFVRCQTLGLPLNDLAFEERPLYSRKARPHLRRCDLVPLLTEESQRLLQVGTGLIVLAAQKQDFGEVGFGPGSRIYQSVLSISFASPAEGGKTPS